MPRSENFTGSVKLIVLEAGRVEYNYFSPDEISSYKWQGNIRPRVDISRMDAQDDTEDVLKDIVKTVAKKIFLDEKKAHFEKEKENFFDSNMLENNYEDDEFKVPQKISDIEELEKKLNEYIDSENYKKAAEIKDKIAKQKDSDT